MSNLILNEFECTEHGRFDDLVDRSAADAAPCPECGEACRWVISAPHPKVLTVVPTAAVRGGDTERRPGMLDTRPLAEGMPMTEWKAKQRAAQQERRWQQGVDNGLFSKKITVG